MFKPEQLAVVPPTSKVINPFVEVDKKDDQLVLPRETVELLMPLTMAIMDKPVPEDPIQ